MVKEKRAGDAYKCPTCHHPVPPVAHRHKSLGVYVPEWGPGPCENPECPDYRLDPRHKHATDRR